MDDLTIEDLKDLQRSAYGRNGIWGSDMRRPSPKALDKWAGMAAQLRGISSFTRNEVGAKAALEP